MSDTELQARLLNFATIPKTVAMPGHWALPSQGEKTARLVVPLAVGGVATSGLVLELSAPLSRRREFEGFSALLFAQLAGRR